MWVTVVSLKWQWQWCRRVLLWMTSHLRLLAISSGKGGDNVFYREKLHFYWKLSELCYLQKVCRMNWVKLGFDRCVWERILKIITEGILASGFRRQNMKYRVTRKSWKDTWVEVDELEIYILKGVKNKNRNKFI